MILVVTFFLIQKGDSPAFLAYKNLSGHRKLRRNTEDVQSVGDY